jgi:hypothetical protein
MGAYQIASGQSCEANAGLEALQGSCSHACKHRIEDRNMTLDTTAKGGGGWEGQVHIRHRTVTATTLLDIACVIDYASSHIGA